MIQAIWSLLTAAGHAEIRSLRINFFYILGMIMIIPIIQLITNGWGYITALYGVICILSIGWRLANIRRILSLTGLGEAAELVKIVEGQTGFPPNKIIGLYIAFAESMLCFALAYFLMICFVNLREWLPSIIFVPFLSAIIATYLGIKSRATLKILAGATVIFWIAFAAINLFPQIGYYSGLENLKGKVVSAEAARLANDADKLRAKQRAETFEKMQQGVLAWQKENPGRDIPEEFKKELEAAKAGLSLEEYAIECKTDEEKAKIVSDIKNYLAKGQKFNDILPEYRRVWEQFQSGKLPNVSRILTEAKNEKVAATEKAVAAAPAPQATPQTEVQPQKETARNIEFMEVEFDGRTTRNNVVLKNLDQNCIEFVQVWENGHKVFYSGQKKGGNFVGSFHHVWRGDSYKGNFRLNSRTLEGEFQETESSYASFRLL